MGLSIATCFGTYESQCVSSSVLDVDGLLMNIGPKFTEMVLHSFTYSDLSLTNLFIMLVGVSRGTDV